MHNKFCIIDNNILITGSYNYTYLAESINSENIVVIKGVSDIIESYKIEFNNLISGLEAIKSISDYHLIFPCTRYEPESIIEKIQKSANTNNTQLNSFQIKDVIYKQWQEGYYTDKIQVFDKQLILFFRCRCLGSGPCWVIGPKSEHGWLLRNSKNHDQISLATRITNIKINERKVVTSISDEEIFLVSSDGKLDDNPTDIPYKLNKKKQLIKENGQIVPLKVIVNKQDPYEISCEIHFNIEDFTLETVDLIEGVGTDTLDSHWHCFDINLQMNREPL